MGRIGKRALAIPAGVEVKIEAGKITVKGPKGTLVQEFNPEVTVKVVDKNVLTICDSLEKRLRAQQGLYNSLIKNMMTGVTQGFEKQLELVGVGYRAQLQGKKLTFQIGYSHPVEINPPEGITFVVEGTNKIKVKGFDRQVVGQVAAQIRQVRKVEPYKGKGIKYAGEYVRRKAGKAAKATTGGAA